MSKFFIKLLYVCANMLYFIHKNKMYQEISDSFKNSNTNSDNAIDEINNEVISSKRNC